MLGGQWVHSPALQPAPMLAFILIGDVCVSLPSPVGMPATRCYCKPLHCLRMAGRERLASSTSCQQRRPRSCRCAAFALQQQCSREERLAGLLAAALPQQRCAGRHGAMLARLCFCSWSGAGLLALLPPTEIRSLLPTPLLQAATELCWLTCACSRLNGDELARAGGLRLLARLLMRCMAGALGGLGVVRDVFAGACPTGSDRSPTPAQPAQLVPDTRTPI